MTTLNVFGSCNVLNCSIDIPFDTLDKKSWIYFACKNLNLDCQNFAKKSVDNNYLYNIVLTKLKEFNPQSDVILVAWCDPSSKLFLSNMIDDDVRKYSIIYEDGLTPNKNWVRSAGAKTPGWNGTFDYTKNFGNPFYDNYFHNYLDKDLALLETWQKVSSLSSILTSLKYKHIFTSDSNLFTGSDISYQSFVKANTNWFYPNQFGIVEYTNYFDLANGPDDRHLNVTGHLKLSKDFTKYYTNELRY